VTAIIIVGVAAATVLALGIVFGGPLLGAILAAVLLVGGTIWFFAMGGSETTASEVVEEAHEQEFLGPGGPDDPNA
jgi:hypothetical protein